MKMKRNSGVTIEESGTDSIAKRNQFSSNKDKVKRQIFFYYGSINRSKPFRLKENHLSISLEEWFDGP